MEFSVAEMFGSADIIAGAGAQPGLRLFAVEKNQSGTPRDDLIEAQYAGGWVEASPETICGAAHGRTHESFCQPHCGPSASVDSFKRDTWYLATMHRYDTASPLLCSHLCSHLQGLLLGRVLRARARAAARDRPAAGPARVVLGRRAGRP